MQNPGQYSMQIYNQPKFRLTAFIFTLLGAGVLVYAAISGIQSSQVVAMGCDYDECAGEQKTSCITAIQKEENACLALTDYRTSYDAMLKIKANKESFMSKRPHCENYLHDPKNLATWLPGKVPDSQILATTKFLGEKCGCFIRKTHYSQAN